jgi:hypothetical protein
MLIVNNLTMKDLSNCSIIFHQNTFYLHFHFNTVQFPKLKRFYIFTYFRSTTHYKIMSFDYRTMPDFDKLEQLVAMRIEEPAPGKQS